MHWYHGWTATLTFAFAAIEMSTAFSFDCKYKGSMQVTGWVPTQAQPRPGLIEVNVVSSCWMCQSGFEMFADNMFLIDV